MNSKRSLAVVFSVFLILFATHALAQPDPAGRILSVRGFVSATDANGDMRTLGRGDNVNNSDLIETADRARLVILFSDNSRYTLRENTSFKIEQYVFSQADDSQGQARFSILRGALQAVSGLIGRTNRENYRLNTPISTIGLRGTTFQVEVIRDESGTVQVRLSTLEGAVVYSSVVTGDGNNIPIPDDLDASADISVLTAEIDETTGEIQSLVLESGDSLSQGEQTQIDLSLGALFPPEPNEEEGDAEIGDEEAETEEGDTEALPLTTTPDGGSPI